MRSHFSMKTRKSQTSTEMREIGRSGISRKRRQIKKLMEEPRMEMREFPTSRSLVRPRG